MLGQRHDGVPRSESAEKPPLSIGAMAFAQKVAAEYKELEAGYRKKLYNFIGRALTSYRKFLRGKIARKALLSQDIITGLREKPQLEKTSRLLLYFLTDAQNEADRNTAGKYARIVDYLHKERVANADAADYVRGAGGIDEILKKARGSEALKAAHQTRQEEHRDFDQGEEPDEAPSGALTPSDITDDLFDPDHDLSIRVTDKVHARVLGPDIDIGESFYLECRKTGPAGYDGIRIVGRLVDPPSE